MSSNPNGIMIAERPNAVQVRYQKKHDGDFSRFEVAVEQGLEAARIEVMSRQDGFGLDPKGRVRVTLLVEVVK